MITLTMHKAVVDGHFVDDGFTHKTFVMLNDLLDNNCILKAPSLMYEVIVPEMFSEIEVEDTDDLADAIEEMFDELDAKDVPAYKTHFYVEAGQVEPSTGAQEETPEPEHSDTDGELGSEAEPLHEPTPDKYECILVNGTDFKGWVSNLHGQDTASNGEAE